MLCKLIISPSKLILSSTGRVMLRVRTRQRYTILVVSAAAYNPRKYGGNVGLLAATDKQPDNDLK